LGCARARTHLSMLYPVSHLITSFIGHCSLSGWSARERHITNNQSLVLLSRIRRCARWRASRKTRARPQKGDFRRMPYVQMRPRNQHLDHLFASL
jgi:hypothetical protein